MTRASPQGRTGGWTPDRVDLLYRHFALGLTAGESADILGGVSRNAVICKRLRLGLTTRAAAPCGVLAGLLAGCGFQSTEPPPLPCRPLPDMDIAPPPDARPSRLADKRRRDCSWPLGPAAEPGDHLTLYCCAPRAGRSPYCPVHADVARGQP